MSSFTCPYHGVEITDANRDGCPDCIAWLAARHAPEDMTPDERVADMERLVNPLTIAFRTIHPRLEALVGRPVFTHEIAMCWCGAAGGRGSWVLRCVDRQGAAERVEAGMSDDPYDEIDAIRAACPHTREWWVLLDDIDMLLCANCGETMAAGAEDVRDEVPDEAERADMMTRFRVDQP